MLVASPCQYMKCLQGIHRCLERARQISGKCGLFSATNFTRMHFDEGVLLCMHIWWFRMWIQTVTTSIAVFKTSVEWKHCRCDRVSLRRRVLFASKNSHSGLCSPSVDVASLSAFDGETAVSFDRHSRCHAWPASELACFEVSEWELVWHIRSDKEYCVDTQNNGFWTWRLVYVSWAMFCLCVRAIWRTATLSIVQ